ncbi:rod shape-determining protein MreD [Bacillus methanolicus]|uniref:rod shape-determining protein MreD n=1 Tax=Bacillus methanolicus TaxID=1471 RepID=UPI00238018D2|nr:rod shape-determining protein MreD [Bacillus methanolicus]MDE3839767.1 rod shape-determining protein MreD [Bacillus methanolicus]
MNRFLLPVMLAAFFVIESVFVQLLPDGTFTSDRILVPRFLIIAIFFLTVYGNKQYGIIYGFVFGLLFDVFYTEILGIYLFLFPLMAYVVSKMMKVLQTNIVIVTIVSIIGVALLELGAYEMNFLIHRTDMDFPQFVSLRLLPTIILNLVFSIIAAYPLKRQYEKFAEHLTE